MTFRDSQKDALLRSPYGSKFHIRYSFIRLAPSGAKQLRNRIYAYVRC